MTKKFRTGIGWLRSGNLKSKIQKQPRRPKWVGFLVVLLVACGAGVEAQQPKKVPRIGYLSPVDVVSDSTQSEAIRLALRERGYIEGQNIVIEYRYAEGKRGRAPELAADLVRLKVDMIVVSGGTIPIRAAKNATKTIPIVMTGGGSDPVAAGLIDSLTRPGGNVTGITLLSRELGGNGWSYSKKPFQNLPVSRFSTIRPHRTV